MADPIETYFTDQAADQMRRFIQEAGGNEVYVVGQLDHDRRVAQVQLFARGNEFAVPALMQVAYRGSVVIHNHPSGNLEPSDADLGIASRLGNESVAFFIVNNTVDQIYAVVEPFSEKERIPLDAAALQAFLGDAGPISTSLPGYELRPQQLAMVEIVAEAVNQDQIAVIEAGTGTGKTLAYLLPAARNALENKERWAISTNTINLQEQLIAKDIPFLQSVFDKPFKAVLVKGRTNYLCRRKLLEVSSDPTAFSEPEQMGELQAIVEWAKTTPDGSRSDLSFIPSSEVWEKVQSESDTTLRLKCPFYNECFFYRARREAASANLLVVNHHLLFADLSVRAATGEDSEIVVLPKYDRVVLDEAHNVEEVATNYFGSAISYVGLKRILGKLIRVKAGKEKGLLPFLTHKFERLPRKARVEEKHLRELAGTAAQHVVEMGFRLDESMSRVFDWLQVASPDENTSPSIAGSTGFKLRLTAAVRSRPDWSDGVIPHVNELLREGVGVLRDLDVLLDRLAQLEADLGDEVLSLTVDLRAQRDRLDAGLMTISNVVLDEPVGGQATDQDEEHVRWIEGRQGRWGLVLQFRSAPLEVSELLKEALFERFRSVILTSATLTVENRFEYLKKRLGLDLVRRRPVTELQLPPSFDYRSQAIIGIPTDIPTPNDDGFPDVLPDLVLRAVDISKGRAFVLFTSFALLNKTYEAVESQIRALGYTPLRQGDSSRHRLLERFRQEKSSVLFGTDSFWEGVDVQGDALQLVVITRLPFRVPSEPVVQARVEAIARRGGNPFIEYSVPQATIRFKQGFGRLIRSKQDYGAVLILDKRVLTKSYGRTFLSSLPECRVIRGQKEEVFQGMGAFFESFGGVGPRQRRTVRA